MDVDRTAALPLDHTLEGGLDTIELDWTSGPPPLSRAPSQASRATCAGLVRWLIPERESRECVLVRGHGGDHRDVAGYRWNDDRWSD